MKAREYTFDCIHSIPPYVLARRRSSLISVALRRLSALDSRRPNSSQAYRWIAYSRRHSTVRMRKPHRRVPPIKTMESCRRVSYGTHRPSSPHITRGRFEYQSHKRNTRNRITRHSKHHMRIHRHPLRHRHHIYHSLHSSLPMCLTPYSTSFLVNWYIFPLATLLVVICLSCSSTSSPAAGFPPIIPHQPRRSILT